MNSLIWPMFVMFLLTACVVFSMGFRRLRAVQRREVDFRFYKVYQGAGEPEAIAAHSRHLINLFEAPMLFYVAILTALATGQGGSWLLGLAWAYVALRLLHSAIHLTSNQVLWRFRVFGLSWVVLVALWLQLALQVEGG